MTTTATTTRTNAPKMKKKWGEIFVFSLSFSILFFQFSRMNVFWLCFLRLWQTYFLCVCLFFGKQTKNRFLLNTTVKLPIVIPFDFVQHWNTLFGWFNIYWRQSPIEINGDEYISSSNVGTSWCLLQNDRWNLLHLSLINFYL